MALSKASKITSTKQRWISPHSVHPIAETRELPRPENCHGLQAVGNSIREEYRALALPQVAVNFYFDCCTHKVIGEVILKVLLNLPFALKFRNTPVYWTGAITLRWKVPHKPPFKCRINNRDFLPHDINHIFLKQGLNRPLYSGRCAQ